MWYVLSRQALASAIFLLGPAVERTLARYSKEETLIS